MEPLRAAKSRWLTVLDPVHGKLESFTTDDAVKQNLHAALQTLNELPWDGGLKGFKAGGSVEELAHWFTREWLRSDHEDQMLELLTSDLALNDGSASCIKNTFFVCKLAKAYSNPERYRTDQDFKWLRRLGTSFATKGCTRFGSIANENEDHWTALAIDADKCTVGYGNGFHTDVPDDLREHLDWWLFEHLGVEFKWVDIPVVRQLDPHSCGILAYFALAHWFDPKRFPLPDGTAASMADERIKMFLRIVQHNDRAVRFY
ncbi:hypothetical protein B0H15DRAFT_785202 [Mycena belliarum]|uniref:Ubiquitin-like protease family profile domain-containing protein n=1 Tax=Mycena belliarum TaxID=1033014 RepID=A0AAD6U2Z9_9AGAR|nr:hypothetical protein B0H15DRAFT_785131 [Mycena belliae]KAJ7083065.1 hypothetical protein B0H15DRAFT_785202 [Mycena belliae]